MKYDPDKHHRRSIQLKGYDYGSAGAYFATICAQNRTCWFGAVADGEMRLNDAGRVAQASWGKSCVHLRLCRPAVSVGRQTRTSRGNATITNTSSATTNL